MELRHEHVKSFSEKRMPLSVYLQGMLERQCQLSTIRQQNASITGFFFVQKSLMTIFHICESKVISLYACKRTKDDSQSVVDIDKRVYVFTLLMVL